MRFRSKVCIIVIALLSIKGFGQKSEKSINLFKAQKLHQTRSYSAILKEFRNQKIDPDASNAIELLAESYRLTGDTPNAEYWYSEMAKKEDAHPTEIFYYAQALQSFVENNNCRF